MSLALNFSVCQVGDCKSLILKELTGFYGDGYGTSPTGWGTPNPVITDYNFAKFEFYLNGTTLVKTISFTNETFPSDDTSFEYEADETLDDGWYRIVYTVQTEEGVTTDQYTKTIFQSFYCNIKCCLWTMYDNIDLDCDCSKDKIEEFNKAWFLFKGLERNSKCGNTTKFNNILVQLQKICLNSNCSNCK